MQFGEKMRKIAIVSYAIQRHDIRLLTIVCDTQYNEIINNVRKW